MLPATRSARPAPANANAINRTCAIQRSRRRCGARIHFMVAPAVSGDSATGCRSGRDPMTTERRPRPLEASGDTMSVLGGDPTDPASRQRVAYLPGDLALDPRITGWEQL